MAALVQTFPQQTGTVTMLQTRPASASGMMPPQGQPGSQYGASQQPRHSFYGTGNNIGGGPALYRSATGPIQPYAFTSTPSLHSPNNWQPQPQQQYTRGSFRPTPSIPGLPRMQSFDSPGSLGRVSRQPASSSMVNLPTGSSMPGRYPNSRDDSSLPGQGSRRIASALRPQSAYMTSSAPQLSFTQAMPIRPSPDRYRRSGGNSGAQQQKQSPQTQSSAMPSGSGMASVGHLYSVNGGGNGSLPELRQRTFNLPSQTQPQFTRESSDDIQLHRQASDDAANRFHRRSMPSLNATESPDLNAQRQPASKGPGKDMNSTATSSQRPFVMHSKDGSSESVASSFSNASRPSSRPPSRPSSRPSSHNNNAAAPVLPAIDTNTFTTSKQVDNGRDNSKDALTLVNIPPRISSDAASRLANTSTSKPTTSDEGSQATLASETTATPSTAQPNKIPKEAAMPAKLPSHLESPAMRHLSAINQKGDRLRSKTSKLRRAFSFGSAADFRKAASASEQRGEPVTSPNKLQKEPTSQELYDAEQARIVQQQEEGGIGSSIYAGARIFSGSTDNLSISSTASSASIMIRKMGRGMKKSTRSLVGLFRPKSIVGVPAMDAGISEMSSTTVEASVSMITAEAERERVNYTPDLHAQSGGGTGYPQLERNSIDASRASIASERLGSSGTDNSAPRKSIIESDKERAEALAGVRKGILKNTSGSSSPSRGPGDMRSPPFELHNPPAISESPASSAPSTPNDEIPGHKRSGSVAIGGEDYFVTALRLRQDSRSGSSTPQGSMKRSATFSPRLIFYDTWPSQEYDRRGEIATCNRLTPMLAQQIKEELNSFKMEMEVHENSKIYTHFF